ncbi:YjiH family protein [Cognatishimia maritima]|uniref:Nucleoside recognition GATE domain-containing membrane protein YjiH n=1 Tax=Cognatishimia maritima TaxID=870908 RepID=A0A1M5Q7V4_9RHOB|nr:nucleoside recognition domain-containing protein [Cognatishimia maritima]SHH10277.1 nucleoside recognition GATE domain-containing membrane protein YjiH [Cognatishimia maritima]
MPTDTTVTQQSSLVWLKMIIGSFCGFAFFMIPFKWDGELTILISLIQDKISAPVEGQLPLVIVALMVLSALGSVSGTLTGGAGMNKYFKSIFVTSVMSLIFRVAAAVMSIMAYWKLGHEAVWNEYTGEIIIIYLMPSLLVIFLLATTLLPLLLDFGGVEFIGVYLQPMFKRLFRLPGRASVLTATSWIGSGTNGIIAADIDYKKGMYTAREVSILCLGFGTISMPAVFIYTTSIGGLEVGTFLYFFFTLFVVGVVSTMVIARVPPLSLKSDEFYQGKKNPMLELPKDVSRSKLQRASDIAYKKAEKAPGLGRILKDGVLTTFELYMTVFPLIVVIGILALVATEFTPIFKFIAIPLEPLLSTIGMPEASEAAPAFLVGFADLLLPFLAAEGIESQLTKFVICVTGTVTVICMSETGAILLKSAIPVNFTDLVLVFLLKTVVSIPIALAMGRLYGLN